MPNYQFRALTGQARRRAVQSAQESHLDFIIRRRDDIVNAQHTITTLNGKTNPRKLWFVCAKNDNRANWKKQSIKNAISVLRTKGVNLPREILVYCGVHTYESAGYCHPDEDEWHIFLNQSSVVYTQKDSESVVMQIYTHLRGTRGGSNAHGYHRLVGDQIYDSTVIKKDIKRCTATCLHEMGHALHQEDIESGYYNWQHHKNRVINYQLFLIPAKKVSQYATTEVHDFVAETFSGLMSGFKYSADVLELYNLLGGPARRV